MIKGISERLTGFFINTSVIKEDDRENFNFCFSVILFDLISLLTIIGLSIVFGRTIQTLIYLVGFLSLRFNAGGFHARTHFRCFLTLCFSYIAFIALLALIPSALYIQACLAAVFISVPTIFALAPIEHVNRQLSPKEVRLCKVKCRLAACAWLVIIVTMLILVKAPSVQLLLLSVSLGMLSIALSLIAAKITNILRRNEHDKSKIGSL